MKKFLLPVFVLIGVGTSETVQAQAGLVNLIGAGVVMGVRAARGDFKTTAASKAAADKAEADKAAADKAAQLAALGPAAPQELVLHRTPADQLPKKAATQITALETQLDACHAAMLASPTGAVCTPEQRTAIQSAAVGVARAQPGWNLQPYQQEMAFYLAEDARRQQAAAPAPAK